MLQFNVSHTNKIIGIFLFGLLAAGSALAQSQTISGYSIYTDRGAWLKGVADAGITPAIGTQTFESLPAGLYNCIHDVGGVVYLSAFTGCAVAVAQTTDPFVGRVLRPATSALIAATGNRAIGFDVVGIEGGQNCSTVSVNTNMSGNGIGFFAQAGGFVGVIAPPERFNDSILIQSACLGIVLLDNISYPGGPDSSPTNPNPPVPCPLGIGSGAFCFIPPTALGPEWYDPPAAAAFDFSSPDAKFISINDFPTGFAAPFTVSTGGVVLGSFMPGQSVHFPNGGVNEFRISGISPTVDGGNPFAFPINLTLDKVGVIFTMRPVQTSTPTPTLGNYPDTSVQLSGDTTVVPDAAPTNTTSINVSTSTDFKGKLEGDPSTGSVRVTDAHPAGTYIVTIKAFIGGTEPTATKTFTLTVTTPSSCNPVSFAAAVNLGVGAKAGQVLVGDFNDDGRQDLAVAELNGTAILLGDGTGGFNVVTELANVGARAVGDFNGDGKQDLAILNASNVVILFGDGTGHFVSGSNFDTGCAAPFQLAVGDFNGDSRLDMAFACFFSDTVTIVLGNGAGGFSTATSFGVSDGPQGLAVGDFNGDGRQDLAVACMPAGLISILLGDGAGTLAASTNFNAGATPRDIEIGDFNGDGSQDLAVSNPGFNAASVMLGNGAGGFGAPTTFAVGSNPTTEIAIGDFNGDARQDLAVPNFGSNDVSILLGDGAGSFGAATNFSVGLSPFGVVVGDFNGDGMQDLATANWDSNDVSILLRDCAPAETQINSLITSINNSALVPDGIKTSVNAKLQDALAALESGDIATACIALQDVQNEIRAQRGKKIPVGQADALRNSVIEIRTNLGCE